jgi:hypothetical protein
MEKLTEVLRDVENGKIDSTVAFDTIVGLINNQQRELLIAYHRNLIINEEYANLLSDVEIEVDRYLKII